ncbi:MAG: carbohydrate kinase family protein [Anaerolineae bacterium]|nr:carbohydrate kinase family protein [Anaerolineae bacterium]
MMTKLYDVFVIGTASQDRLHLVDGRLAHSAGGAALYTALAAAKSRAATGLFAPKPQPMPQVLQPVDAHVTWMGPLIAPDRLPRLEIAHHGGGRATLIDASWGAEDQLDPKLMPNELLNTKTVHIAALSSAQRQLDFAQAVQKQVNPPLLSVGTYARLVYNETHDVRRLLVLADLFFMNENEAKGLFGSVEQAQTRPGARLFVTLDSEGVLVIEGSQATHVPGHPVPEIDPTGAGDTFCGATLAGLAQGLSPVASAQQAVKLAAQTVRAVGPEALLGNSLPI